MMLMDCMIVMDPLCHHWSDTGERYERCMEYRLASSLFCAMHHPLHTSLPVVVVEPPPPKPRSPVPPKLPVSLQDVVQREVEIAEQIHRLAVRDARRRKAAAVREARAYVQQQAKAREQQRQQARAWFRLQQADKQREAEEQARWKEVGKISDEIAHERCHEAHETYAINFRETYGDDAYYLDAIEPYTWR
jgi:hypothetical protein